MIQAQVLRTEKPGVFTHAAHYASIQLFSKYYKCVLTQKRFRINEEIQIKTEQKVTLRMQNLLHVVLEFHGSYFVDQFGTRQSFCVYCIFFSSSLRTKSCCRSPFPMSVGKISICLKKTNKLLNINGIINIISTKIQVTNYPSYVWTKGSVLITVTL